MHAAVELPEQAVLSFLDHLQLLSEALDRCLLLGKALRALAVLKLQAGQLGLHSLFSLRALLLSLVCSTQELLQAKDFRVLLLSLQHELALQLLFLFAQLLQTCHELIVGIIRAVLLWCAGTLVSDFDHRLQSCVHSLVAVNFSLVHGLKLLDLALLRLVYLLLARQHLFLKLEVAV